MERELIKKIFYSPPVVATERLVLRPIDGGDVRDMFEYSCDPDVTKYLTWEPHRDIAYTKRYIKCVERSYKAGVYYDWALELRATGKMIGTCGFTSISPHDGKCEIGYVINPRFRGYSLAAEAASAVISFAFERLEASLVFARFIEGNEASRRVMEKCGMIYAGDFEDAAVKAGKRVGVTRYEMSLERYLRLKQTGEYGI